MRLQMRSQRGHVGAGVAAGSHPQADLRPRPRNQGVRRGRDGRRVDPDNGDGRLGPQPLDDGTGTDFPDAVEQTRFLSNAFARIVDVGRDALVQTGDDDVALVVVQAGEQADEGRDRVGHHASPQARMQAVIECRDLDHTVDQAAQ